MSIEELKKQFIVDDDVLKKRLGNRHQGVGTLRSGQEGQCPLQQSEVESSREVAPHFGGTRDRLPDG